ncbi:MAG TPA: response regulator, partial [Rhodocyclaceae bacterium]|nr:response regulator [Rhodocyclaceae bacterium]
TPPPVIPSAIIGTKVLIADNNDRHRTLLGEQFAEWELRAHGVNSIPTLLAELDTAIKARLPFRVVLLETTLLEGSGDTVIQKIAALPDPPSIILMQPVNTKRRSTDTEKYPNVAARLLKPLLQEDLLNTLLIALGQSAVSDRSKSLVRQPTGRVNRSLDILLAEDNPINQTLALRMLEKLGHHTHVVANGQAAVDAVSRHAYDVILMDVQMPVMGGFEATAAIRELELGLDRRTPIVAMTAHAMAGDRERCLAAGMDDYVSKPIQTSALDGALLNAIGQDLDEPDSGDAEMPDLTAPFDRSALIDSLGGDLELYAEIVRLFLSHYPGEIETLQRELEAGNAEALHRTAHSLKGAISNFAAPRATEAARILEQALKSGIAENTKVLVGNAIAAIQELSAALRADLEKL